MFRRLIIMLCSIFLSCITYSQFDTAFAKSNIRKCADSLTYAFKIKDWDLFARYNNPALIGSLGGKEEFKKYISLMFSQVPVSAWKQYEPGKILQIIKTGGDLQTVIELNSILDWQGQRITSTSYLVGESWDGGLFWTFFDSSGDRTTAQVIKPDLNDELIIPEKKEKKEPIPSPVKNKE